MTNDIQAIRAALEKKGFETCKLSGYESTGTMVITSTTTFYFYDENGSIKIRKSPRYSLKCKTMHKDLEATVKYINRYIK